MTYAFVKDSNQISINDFTDEQPGQYDFKVDTLNNILVIRAQDGSYKAEVHALVDTITINGDSFTGTAAELKTQLLADVFTSSSDGGGSVTIYGPYASNAAAITAGRTAGDLYKSTTEIFGSPIILQVV